MSCPPFSLWRSAPLVSALYTAPLYLSPCEFLLSKPLSSHGLPRPSGVGKEVASTGTFVGQKREIGRACENALLSIMFLLSSKQAIAFDKKGDSIEAKRLIPRFPCVSFSSRIDLERGRLSIETGTMVQYYRTTASVRLRSRHRLRTWPHVHQLH